MFLKNQSRLTFQLTPDVKFDINKTNKIKDFLLARQQSLSSLGN